MSRLLRKNAIISRLLAFWVEFKASRLAVVGILVIASGAVISLFAPFMPIKDPFETTLSPFAPPSFDNAFGTDSLGRDLFSRVLWGTRVSLVFGVGVATLSLIIGVFAGAISGYFGGWLDSTIMRLSEIFLMLPTMFLIIVTVSILGSNISILIVIVALTIWPSNAKIIRAQVLALKKRGFVEAAIVSGAGGVRILFTHILPNGLSAVIANSTLQMVYAIIIEAALSFLGLGDRNVISYGQILFEGQMYMTTAWWIILFPGLAIFLIIFALNLISDRISYLLNPRETRHFET